MEFPRKSTEVMVGTYNYEMYESNRQKVRRLRHLEPCWCIRQPRSPGHREEVQFHSFAMF